jgi:hypothetical protein
MGISKNSNQLTTNIHSITSSDILALSASASAGIETSVTVSTILESGSVIRPHTTGTVDQTGAACKFRVVKISN